MKHRVEYFSKGDLAVGHMLSKAERILREYNAAIEYDDINDIVELYHIKRYLDESRFLSTWTENDKSLFRITVKQFWTAINVFFNGIADENIETYYANVEWSYQDSFWELIDKTQAYKRVSKETFGTILQALKRLEPLVERKNIVQHYDMVLRNYLITYTKSAELLLSKYEKKKDHNEKKIYLPPSLSLSDKADILDKYLDWDDANLNYVRLIITARSSAEFNIPDKIRLKAQKRDKKETEELLKQNSIGFGYEISFSENQPEPKLCKYEDRTLRLSYSASWINAHNDTISLFRNFITLFELLDNQCCVSLVSKTSEGNWMDHFGIQSKNEYPDNFTFTSKNSLASMQIFAYSYFLEKQGYSLETIIQNAFNQITAECKIEHLNVNFPSTGTSTLEKIRILLPEMESLLKRYKLYIENGIIDPDLLNISSSPCRVNDIPSLVNNKYVYGIADKIGLIQYHFFSDQSMLHYVEPFHDQYQSLYDLLINEDITLSQIENWQLDEFQNLISDQYLTIDNDGFIRINKLSELAVFKELYTNEVLSYAHYTIQSQSIIEDLHTAGYVEYGNTLFSTPEVSYFNYYLNKSEYSNGADLRNKYAHGTHHYNESVIKTDYYQILILFVLLEWKVIDDIMISNLQTVHK